MVSSDAFGRALLDWTYGGTIPETVERDDGYMERGAGPEVYLAPFREWPTAERQALRFARGRVLDVGCGAGRVSRHLQRRGFDVVGLDASDLAARAARRNGVTTVWRTPMEDLGRKLRSFDTVVLFGNNFGLFESPERARKILTNWAEEMPSGARVLVESTNAYSGGAPGFDRAYFRRNRELGRPTGQLRLRYRYGDDVSDWFNWLFVSRSEMKTILRGTGWHQSRVLGPRAGEPYVAVLEKE